MPIKFLIFFLFTIVSCGREVNISQKKLEYNSSLSDGVNKAETEGTLLREDIDHITANGSTYPISIYSSHQAIEFISTRPLNQEIPVKFKGSVSKGSMVLELIESR